MSESPARAFQGGMKRRAACLLLPLVTLATPAWADDSPPGDHTEVRFGMLGGGYSVREVSGSALGLDLALARTFGRLELELDGSFSSLRSLDPGSTQPTGYIHRLGLSARYNFWRWFPDVPIGLELYVQGGTGWEEIRWEPGGRLGRQDASFGFGIDILVRTSRSREHPRMFVTHFGFLGLVARSPHKPGAPEICAGPCDEPTGPYPYDLGAFADVSLGYAF